MFIARFRDASGKFGTQKSTGILDKGRPKDREDAVAWCERYLAGGQVTTGANMRLDDYGEGFFDWSADYARGRILRGERYSQEQAYKHGKNFAKWIKGEAIGKLRLEAIDSKAVAAWQLRLARAGLASATIHQQTMTLRILLTAAHGAGYLRQPIEYQTIKTRPKVPKGILTIEEAAALFSLRWDDPRYLVGNLLGSVTGLRAGEIVGLRFSNVLPDRVLAFGTWRPQTAIVSDNTKGGVPRTAPVPPPIMAFVRALMAVNPWRQRSADPFVFFSVKTPDRAMEQRELTEALHDRLDAMLGQEARRSRTLGFHSWRHYANTNYLEGAVPPEMVQKTIGHANAAMTMLYYRPQALAPIKAVQETVVSAYKLPEPALTLRPRRRARPTPAGRIQPRALPASSTAASPECASQTA